MAEFNGLRVGGYISMYSWDMKEIREAIQKSLSYYLSLKNSVNELTFETTNEYVFDVYGESECPNKLKGGKLLNISVSAENKFSVQEIYILYGGEIIEQKVFVSETAGNQEYAEVIREFGELSREYECELPMSDPFGYVPHSYVTFEQDAQGNPVIKLITIEHVYGIDEPFGRSREKIAEIREIEMLEEVEELKHFDVYRFLGGGPDGDRPKRLTKVHVKGNIVYEVYGGEQLVYDIDDIYEDYVVFTQFLDKFEKDLAQSNLKRRWLVLEGMDIERMDQLAAAVTMEIYFASGRIIPRESSVMEKPKESLVHYLHACESLEDYIGILTEKLEEEDCRKVRQAFLHLKDNADEKPLEILHKFMKPYLNGRYEVGKVYFAVVMEECLKRTESDRDALVRLYDEESHYKFVEKLLYGEYIFMDFLFRDYPAIVQMEYGSGVCWNGNAVLDAHLKDNIYVENGTLRPHGWKWETIPVRVIGFMKDGMPVVEYAQDWHH